MRSHSPIRLFSTLCVLAGFVAPLSGKVSSEKETLLLVEEGQPRAVIWLPKEASGLEREAAQKLQDYIRTASGAELPIRTEGEAVSDEKEEVVNIAIGRTRAARQAGIVMEQLPPEAYGIKTVGQTLFLYGCDADLPPDAPWSRSRTTATKWAVNELVKTEMGVRWLWPGRLGTDVPRRRTIRVRRQESLRQPVLQERVFRARNRLMSRRLGDPAYLVDPAQQRQLAAEARDWLEDHQSGSRAGYQYGHAFFHWWEKYGAAHPDYFAVPPSDAFAQPYPHPGRVKLRLSNPEVIDRIEEEYVAAGCPPFWNISPNDGDGFDTSAATSAWDIPRDQDKLTVWRAKGDLTARYVTFWNKVHGRLKKHNPDLALVTLLYGAYRNPPPPEVALEAKLIGALVPPYTSHEIWKGWSDHGVSLILRPNWWHSGGSAPYIPVVPQAEFIRFAARNGMVGFNADSLLGYWATQGLNYYVTARVVEEPEIDPLVAIGEYTAAFGKAEPKIRAYFDGWMEFSRRAAYPVSAGGSISINPDGLYETAARRHRFDSGALTGSFHALRYLYEEETLAKPLAILKEAEALAREDTERPEALERVQFLASGLQELRLVRETLKLGYRLREKPEAATVEAFLRKADELRDHRRQMTLRHAIWGESVYAEEIRRKVPTTPQVIPAIEEAANGL